MVGQCEIKNLQIFAPPDRFVLKPVIENYNYDINFNFNEIEVQINDCSKDQIRMMDNNKYVYCETPICKNNCPVGTTAKCKPPSLESHENDKMKNICDCIPGWKGDNCNERKYVDFR